MSDIKQLFCDMNLIDPRKPWEVICYEIMAERDSAGLKLGEAHKRISELEAQLAAIESTAKDRDTLE